jgi:hypothetical protein
VDGRKLLCRNREEITLRKAIILSLAVVLLFTSAAAAETVGTVTIYYVRDFDSAPVALAEASAYGGRFVATNDRETPFLVVYTYKGPAAWCNAEGRCYPFCYSAGPVSERVRVEVLEARWHGYAVPPDAIAVTKLDGELLAFLRN